MNALKPSRPATAQAMEDGRAIAGGGTAPAALVRCCDRARHLPGALAVLALAVLAVAGVDAAAAQLPGRLLFTPLQPCRIVDTRLAGGPLAPGVFRDFDVAGSASFAGQGGSASGCGVPGYVFTQPQAAAVVVNLVAVGAAGAGHLTAWPADQPQPLASVINYTADTVANGIVLPLSQDITPGDDLRVVAAVSGVHLVADIVGYFAKLEVTGDDVQDGSITPADVAGALYATPGDLYVREATAKLISTAGTVSVSCDDANDIAVSWNCDTGGSSTTAFLKGAQTFNWTNTNAPASVVCIAGRTGTTQHSFKAFIYCSPVPNA